MQKYHVVLVSADDLHLAAMSTALAGEPFRVTTCSIGSIPRRNRDEYTVRFVAEAHLMDTVDVLIIDESGSNTPFVLALGARFRETMPYLRLGYITCDVSPVKVALAMDKGYSFILAIEDNLFDYFSRFLQTAVTDKEKFVFSDAVTNAFVELSNARQAMQKITMPQLYVLLLVLEGHRAADIATILRTSANNVHQFVHRLRAAFGVTSTKQLVETVSALLKVEKPGGYLPDYLATLVSMVKQENGEGIDRNWG